MSSGDGKAILENSARAGMDVAESTPTGRVQPAGTVERVLNFQERSLLAAACKSYCAKKDKGDHKAQSKLVRLLKLLSYDDTVEYFDMIDDSVEEQLFKWQRARNDWLLVEQYAAGGISHEELKKRAPLLDVNNPPPKPMRRQPEATPEEIRGRERAFYIPSKLDSWAQDILRETNWANPEKAEYIVELCGKFGIKSDED